jgi:hypothetical protein
MTYQLLTMTNRACSTIAHFILVHRNLVRLVRAVRLCTVVFLPSTSQTTAVSTSMHDSYHCSWSLNTNTHYLLPALLRVDFVARSDAT